MKGVFICLLCWIGLLHAEEGFQAKIIPSAQQILIKDLLNVDIDLTFPTGYEVDVDGLQKNIARSSNFYGSAFTISALNVGPVQQKGDQLSQQIRFTLQPKQIGRASLSFYEIPFIPADKKNKKEILTGDIFSIEVLPIKADPQFEGQLAPLLSFAKTLPIELDQKTIDLIEGKNAMARERKIDQEQMDKKRLPWISTLTILLIGFFCWVFLRQAIRKVPLTHEQIIQLARQQALHEIEALKAKNLPAQGFFDQFYVELTNPIRSYIEKKYQIPLPNRTTPEFLAEAVQYPDLSPQTKKQLGQFLIQADKVKFGLYKPSIEECENAQKMAIKFIETDSSIPNMT